MKIAANFTLSFYLLLVTLLYFFSSSIPVKSQNLFPGNYYIQNYNDLDYNIPENQIWAIVQDKRGIMYFGNNYGLLEFDGNNWRFIETSNKSVVRSMAIDSSGIIYIGAKNEFGFLKSDSTGKNTYASLIHYLPDDKKNFGDVWQTSVIQNKIIFRTTTAIFSISNDTIEIIEPTFRFHTGFNFNNQYIVKERNIGLLELENNKLNVIEGSEQFATDRVYVLLPIDKNKMLLVSRQKGIFIYTPGQNNPNPFTKLKNAEEADKFLISNQVYSGTKLNNNFFALGTVQNGIIIIDENGKIYKHINKNSGLLDNSVWNLFVDKSNNIWTATNNGISYILASSPFTYFGENDGLDGTVYSTYNYNNNLYAGTMLGVYKKNLLDRFTILSNSKGPSWQMTQINNSLYCSHFEGLLKIDNNKVTNVAPEGNTWKLIQYQKNPKYAIAGTQAQGLFLLELENDKFIFKHKIKGFDESSRWFEDDVNGSIWVCHEFNGIYNLRLNDKLDSVIVKRLYTTNHGLPSNVKNYVFNFIKTNGDRRILFGTENGIYTFNPQNRSFSNEEFELLQNQTGFIDEFKQDNKGNIYFQQGTRKGKLFINKNGKYQIQYNPFSKFDGLFVENIYIDNGTTYFSSKDGIILYNSNIKTDTSQRHNTLIRKVIINDSIVYDGTENYNAIIEVPHKKNSFVFHYASQYFEDHKKTMFTYQLKGYDEINQWSDWSTKTEKEYTNLSEGDYTFRIKSKNIFGSKSNIAEYSFTILTPWYKTLIAYISYLIIFVLVTIFGVNVYTRQLKASNIKLEELVKERTAEIELQKEELKAQADNIVHQARLLEKSNIELEKLSIVASETDNAITIMDAEGNFEWVNKGFIQLYEYSFDEFKTSVGKNILDCSDDENINNTLRKCISEKKTVNYEFETKSKYGKLIYVQTTITPIFNDNHEIKKLISIDTDISKLKIAETEIIKQRDEIVKQKQEITDSIVYAKRIQTAVLPPKDNILRNHLDHFIFYMPRDIVSGDFYWFKKIGDTIIVTVADCTGHGVPGAFMSMLGVALLIEITRRKEVTEPGRALNVMREELKLALRQSGKDLEADDGINISMLAINLNKMEMQYAGAYNPLYMIRNDELTVYKADKMPIGISLNEKESFTNQTIKLEKGDLVYLFTDGYIDQFGGPYNRRFTSLKFKKLLGKIHLNPMVDQKRILFETLDNWMGDEDQVDDITVLGLKID